jgi:hypothetical protein
MPSDRTIRQRDAALRVDADASEAGQLERRRLEIEPDHQAEQIDLNPFVQSQYPADRAQ